MGVFLENMCAHPLRINLARKRCITDRKGRPKKGIEIVLLMMKMVRKSSVLHSLQKIERLCDFFYSFFCYTIAFEVVRERAFLFP